jgi:hypothetical protein
MDQWPTKENQVYQINGLGKVQVPKYEIRFGRAERLSDFAEEYQFFTPALLYLHGRFSDEPFAQFIDEYAPCLQLMHRQFQRPVFRGLTTPDGDEAWNHVLWAVEKPVWEELENFLLSVVMMDSPFNWVARVGAQDLTILDPLAADRSAIIPNNLALIDIVALGVDGNKICVAMDPGTNPLMDPPKIKYHAPQPETVAFGNALFAGQNPLEAREAVLHKIEKERKRDEGST